MLVSPRSRSRHSLPEICSGDQPSRRSLVTRSPQNWINVQHPAPRPLARHPHTGISDVHLNVGMTICG
jgi:hypothetical protein